jgi:hypothetical protein
MFLDWKRGIPGHENWVRLNTLLASTAYLERYIYEITLLAFSSDPGLLIGKSRTVNGVHFLKNNIQVRGIDVIEQFTKGSWYTRMKHMQKYFACGHIQRNTIDTLEKIRLMRNRIAHRFGREFITDASQFTSGHTDTVHLTEKRLKAYLQTINDFARDIDSLIYNQHVGNFEILLFWHNWDRKESHRAWNNWTDARKLRYGIENYIAKGSLPAIRTLETILKYYATS